MKIRIQRCKLCNAIIDPEVDIIRDDVCTCRECVTNIQNELSKIYRTDEEKALDKILRTKVIFMLIAIGFTILTIVGFVNHIYIMWSIVFGIAATICTIICISINRNNIKYFGDDVG